MSRNQPKILFAAGGTGGHVFPALAIAGEIRKLNAKAEIHFVGTKGRIEARVVPEQGYPFTPIWISGFHRRITVENLLFPVKVMVSIIQSASLLRAFRPDVVVGTGGYVCGPVLYAASRRGIPTVIHESNSYPGVTTRMLSNRAAKVFTAFQATSSWLNRKDNVEVVGTPVRVSLANASRKAAMKFFGFNASRKTVLVFGGSLGAASINAAAKAMLPTLEKKRFQVIWQTGGKEFPEIQREVGKKKWFHVSPFIENMAQAYAAADLVVCRAGATTIAEITALGKPAILVPYPHAAADHQTQNAMALEKAGAAKVIPDREAAAKLAQTIVSLLGDQKALKQMGALSKKLGRPKAATEIARRILALIN